MADKTTNQKTTNKPKKEKKRGRIKETFAELKKVSWPSFATVVKQTGIVLAVVVIFLAVLMGFDALLGWLYNVMTSSLTNGTAQAVGMVAGKGIEFFGVNHAWLM